MRASTTTATASIAYRRPTQALQLACVLAISLGLSACGTWLESPTQAGHDPVFSAQTTAGAVPLNTVSRLDALTRPSATASTTAAATPSPTQQPSPAVAMANTKAAKAKDPQTQQKPALIVPTIAPSLATPAVPSAAQANTAARAPADAWQLQAIDSDLIAQLKAAEPQAALAVRKLITEPSAYRIGAGDVLSVAVWGYPELSMSTMTATTTASNDSASAGGVGYLVSAGGYIQFPYIGQVYVSGLTETEAYAKLSAALSRFIRNPQLTVRVQNYRSQRVYIDGEVKVPGVYSITDLPMTLPEALNRAGGSLPTSDTSRIQLNRRGKVYALNISSLVASGINPSSIMLAAGDMLRVPSRDDSKIYVIGEVQKPSAIAMQNGRMSLNQALGEAAGISPVSGNARQVYVVRTRSENQGQPAVYHMDIKAPASLILAEQFALQAGDVVYVDASALANWNRVISLILPSAGLLRTGQQITNDR